MDASMLVPLRATLICMVKFSWSMRLCPNHIAGLVEIFCTFFARRLGLDVGFEASMKRHGLSMKIIGRMASGQGPYGFTLRASEPLQDPKITPKVPK